VCSYGGDEATPKVPTTVPQSQMYQGFEVVLKKRLFLDFYIDLEKINVI
jgi:hypothetical protein